MINHLFKMKPLVMLIRRLATFTGTLSISCLAFMPATAESTEYSAIKVEKDDVVTLSDGDRIQVTGSVNNLCGICNKTSGTNSRLNLANDVTINVNGPVAGGIMLNGANAVLEANQLDVNVNGHYGIQVDARNAQLNLGHGSRIELKNNTLMANGIYLGNGSFLAADALTIITQGTGSGLYISDAGTRMDIGSDSLIQTQGAQATGIYIFGRDNDATGTPASLQANRLTIQTAGDLAYGMNIQTNSTVNLGRQTHIDTLGEGAIGIWDLGLLTADELHIKTAGGNGANALEVRKQGVATIGAGSSLYSEKSGALVANGEAAVINFSGNETQRNTVFSGGSYAASAQFDGAIVNLSYTDIGIQGSDTPAIGLWALGGGVIRGDNLAITGNSSAIGVHALTGSEIELTGKTVIRMASPLGMALSTQHNPGYHASRISLSGLIDIVGSVEAAGGIIDLAMAPGSQLTGGVARDGVNGGYLNIRMEQSQWNMPADSVVDNLTLHNSTVNFTAGEAASRLTVGNLAGNGTFALTTDIVARRSDKLVVTGSSAGSHYLQIRNRGDMQTTGQEVLTVVETQDGLANFALAPATGKVELGGYLYDLQRTGSDWQLAAAGTADTPDAAPPEEESPDTAPPDAAPPESVLPEPEPVPVPTPTPEPAPETEQEPAPTPDAPSEAEPEPTPVLKPAAPAQPEISSAADAGANFLNVNYLINIAETQTLLQRFGDLRQQNHLGDGWIRGIGGRFTDFASGKLSRFSLSYSGMQFGFDRQIAPETPVTLGVFMGVTNGKADYAAGRGDLKSSHAGLYISALAHNGLWLDGVVKYARMKNSFSVRDSQNAMVSGEGTSNSYSASLEGGKRFYLTHPEQGFYLEPQIQLSWSHQEGDRLRASNGLRIDLNGYDSLSGRASALAGWQRQQSGLQLNVYIKSGVVREFKGETDYRLNGSLERHSFKGNGWNNGLGVSARIAGQHVIYMEGDSLTGQQFNQRQFNVGYRFSF